MTGFLDFAIEEASNAVVQNREALLEEGTMPIETLGRMQALAGDALEFLAEKAKKENRRDRYSGGHLRWFCFWTWRDPSLG